MRPYLFFLSGMAGCTGIVYAGGTSILKTALILAVVFFGWGVNQVINDILGLKEDRINAPHRPLVTGELPFKTAITISAVFFIAGLAVTAYLNIYAIWIYLAVFLLNVFYEYMKGIPFVGNLVFALLMPLCLYYGAMCVNGAGLEILTEESLWTAAVAFFLINFSMCFFTYYKDYDGDKKTGKKTLVVLLSPEKAKFLNFIFSLLPFAVLFFLPFELNLFFTGAMLLNFLMFQYTAWIFFKDTAGENTYYNLKWNFVTAVLYESSFIMLTAPQIGIMFYVLNFFIVMMLFQLHKDHLS